MGIVVYACDTCLREIELPQNLRGLEVIQRCVITDGCRGRLAQVSVKRDHVIGKFPRAVSGLEDWTARNILYNHNQTIAASSWSVVHNLGINPTVNVFIEREEDGIVTLQETTPDTIVVVSANEITLTFPRSETGVAQLVGRSSRPTTAETAAATTEDAVQLSSSGEITIAVLGVGVGNITVNTIYTTPSGEIVPVAHTVDATPSVLSPWNDADGGLYLLGNRYHVRSFNILTTEITNGSVPPGSSLYFTAPGQTIICLLANDPYQIYDKVQTQYLPVLDYGVEDAGASFFYDDGELFAYPTTIKTIYPPIALI